MADVPPGSTQALTSANSPGGAGGAGTAVDRSPLSVVRENNGGGGLALTLFVLGVFADDANHAAAVDDFALIADLLD